MKVTLRTRRWQGKVKDLRAVAQVKAANQADGDIGTFRKNLLANADASLRAVHSAIDAARGDHYKLTLPWSIHTAVDTARRQGPRLLANATYFDYCEKMGAHRKEITQALNTFCAEYDDCKEKAKAHLNTLYSEDEYPPTSEIRKLFGIDFDFEPLPDEATLHGSTLDKQQAEKIAKLVNERTTQQLENAMRDVWNRLYDSVSHMVDRLSDTNKSFHDTLISNASELATLLTHTNFTNDPRLDELRRDLEGRMLLHDPKELRKNPEQRKAAAEDAKRMLEKMKSYGLGS